MLFIASILRHLLQCLAVVVRVVLDTSRAVVVVVAWHTCSLAAYMDALAGSRCLAVDNNLVGVVVDAAVAAEVEQRTVGEVLDADAVVVDTGTDSPHLEARHKDY